MTQNGQFCMCDISGPDDVRVSDCYGMYSGFYSTSLLFGTGCVDGPGSLSGGAFNQLKLVNYKVLNIPLLT